MSNIIDANKEKNIFDKHILSSTHINFLFGAGVNGNAFPQLTGFADTLQLIQELDGNTDKGFENAIDSLDEQNQLKVKTAFINEFKVKVKDIDFECDSIINIKNMFRKVHQIVKETQNRNPSMKQINIYTLNYDDIIENCLTKLGYFSNSISASNVSENAHLMDVIGYNYKTKMYEPSFMVSKLHGDILNPIIPGKAKYGEVLNEKYFEIAFNMKEHLCRDNSILVVIGYSGNDKHINRLLEGCIDAGLLVYWFKYNNDETLPFEDRHFGNIQIREQNEKTKMDSTKKCLDDLEEIWAEK